MRRTSADRAAVHTGPEPSAQLMPADEVSSEDRGEARIRSMRSSPVEAPADRTAGQGERSRVWSMHPECRNCLQAGSGADG